MGKSHYLLSMIILVVTLVGCNDEMEMRRDKSLQELKKLIPIGSDIDQAIEILKASNFKIVQGKLKPTVDGDHYLVIVLLIDNYKGPGLKSTLYEVTNLSVFYDDFSPFAYIEAHINGAIYSIE